MLNAEQPSVEATLLNLLQMLPREWTVAERDEARHFVDVGELGLALETIAGIAMDEDRVLPDSARSEIEVLAKRMGIADGEVISEWRDHLKRKSRQ